MTRPHYAPAILSVARAVAFAAGTQRLRCVNLTSDSDQDFGVWRLPESNRLAALECGRAKAEDTAHPGAGSTCAASARDSGPLGVWRRCSDAEVVRIVRSRDTDRGSFGQGQKRSGGGAVRSFETPKKTTAGEIRPHDEITQPTKKREMLKRVIGKSAALPKRNFRVVELAGARGELEKHATSQESHKCYYPKVVF